MGATMNATERLAFYTKLIPALAAGVGIDGPWHKTITEAYGMVRWYCPMEPIASTDITVQARIYITSAPNRFYFGIDGEVIEPSYPKVGLHIQTSSFNGTNSGDEVITWDFERILSRAHQRILEWIDDNRDRIWQKQEEWKKELEEMRRLTAMQDEEIG